MTCTCKIKHTFWSDKIRNIVASHRLHNTSTVRQLVAHGDHIIGVSLSQLRDKILIGNSVELEHKLCRHATC